MFDLPYWGPLAPVVVAVVNALDWLGVVMAPLGGILVPEWLYDVLYQIWLWGIPPH